MIFCLFNIKYIISLGLFIFNFYLYKIKFKILNGDWKVPNPQSP